MSLDYDVATLGRVPMFRNFDADALRLLAFGAENRQYMPGKVIFTQGDLADSGYLILSGTVSLDKQQDRGSGPIKTVGQGELVDKMALLTESDRDVTCTAVDQVEVMQIRRNLFRRVLNEYPEVALRLHAEFQDKLQYLLDDLGGMQNRLREV